MEIMVQSLSPKGINVINGFARKVSFTDVIEINRVNLAEGVVDRNKIISLNDLCFSYVSIDAKEHIDFMISLDKPAIEMNFSFSSNSIYEIDGFTNFLVLNAGEHNIVYYPDITYRNHWRPGNKQEMVSIVVSPAYVEKYIPKKKIFFAFLQNMAKERTCLLSENNLPITPHMHLLLREILENKHAPEFRRLHIESRILDLLLQQLEQFEHKHRNNDQIVLRKQDYRKMQEVKFIVEENLKYPYPLTDLAQMVGTNEYNLKKSFKQVFGKTVFGYWTELRMQEAKRLLLSGEVNVNEAASLLGYNDSTNFSAAFKKYFGITPGKIKIL